MCNYYYYNYIYIARLVSPQPLPSHCYYCTIVKDGLESRQANQLAGKVFMVNEPLCSWTKVESILPNAKTVPLTTESVQQTSTHSEATSVEMVVTTLYLFIVLKISPEHNLHQKMPLETVCSKATYASAGVVGLPGVTYTYTDCGRWLYIHHILCVHEKPANTDQNLSFMIV